MARTFFYPDQPPSPRQLAQLHDALQAAIRQLRLALGGGVIVYGFDVRVDGNHLVVAPGLAFDFATGYLFAGDALGTGNTGAFAGAGAQDPDNVFIATSRVRFSF